ncbi:MAG: polyphosphate kinase 1 [Planctomycetes bacterium]|nr:polyphosphate kinase 1 [Planctomycetota bacterium]
MSGNRKITQSEMTAPGAEQRYFTRELSWLKFNRRVLEEAQDPQKPLLERVRFLAITSANLDEFVMVRLAELWEIAHGYETGETPAKDAMRQLGDVRAELLQLVADEYRCWREDVAPRLEKEGFSVVPAAAWAEVDRETLRTYFRDHIEPVLTPLAVDPARPFPLVVNRGITVAVQLAPDEGGETKNAVVAVPGTNRLIGLVSRTGAFALLEDVVMSYLDGLFPGHRIVGRCLFRVTRDGSLDIDEDQATDLLSEIEQELSSREHGHVVRLEVSSDGDPSLRQWLLSVMHLDPLDLVPVDGPLDLTFLTSVPDRLDRRDLRDPPLPVHIYPAEWEDPFARIRAGEILLHHPYQGFQRIVELVEHAAVDERVLAIKQTLYRVSGNSPIVRALARAARAGKQVTVLIELKARFDEAANIKWARALEEAGAHVIYGLVGYKVHAKLMMIIRRDEDGICRYCHIGTGNYNDKTARFYTDISLLTANEAVGRDVASLFNMLTGYSKPPEWERLAVAPLTMRSQFVAWIRREASHAKAGRGGRIIAKFNSLVDTAMVDELYAASLAGVEIDLIVRGMCILRPGVPGLSPTIRVRSIVGRLLEHSRIYHFANHRNPVYAIASADWMTRNLDRRIECLVRIEDEALCARIRSFLDVCLEDNVEARVLAPDGIYTRLTPKRGEQPRPAQKRLLDEAATLAQRSDAEMRAALKFKPRRKGD